MYIYGGSVREAMAQLDRSAQAFLAGCARRFHQIYGDPASEAEQNSWQASWPRLLTALMNAGLGELWIGLEYSLHGSGKRVDALVIGTDPHGSLHVVVVELKQWSNCRLIDSEPNKVLVNGAQTTHPCVQAAGYVRYLQTWLQRADLHLIVSGVAVLHNAPPAMVHALRGCDTAPHGISILGNDDLHDPAVVHDALATAELTAPNDEQIEDFLATRHSPPLSLFDDLKSTLDGNPSMTLLGKQQDALLELQSRLRAAVDKGERHVIVVTGGPGTGKTVIAARLAATIPRLTQDHAMKCTARYLTPSGTLRWQLNRAAGSSGDGIFRNTRDYVKAIPKERHVPLIDEAQRIKNVAEFVPKVLKRTRLCVFFLDEKQIIHPAEGITVDALEQIIRDAGIDTTRIDLVDQFRCGGSQRYVRWIDELLTPGPSPQPWTSGEYDFAVAANPADLQTWVDTHTDLGLTARMSAGFCWPWAPQTSTSPVIDEVTITWIDPVTGADLVWSRPWNSKFAKYDADAGIPVPHSQAWATDPGGHKQVGCIYTTQGLEYPYSAVIMGPDLIRRNDQWEAHPDRSEDPVMHDVSPERYLQLAFNIYRVLLTRGTHGCRLYSTDPHTQAYLESLIPAKTVGASL